MTRAAYHRSPSPTAPPSNWTGPRRLRYLRVEDKPLAIGNTQVSKHTAILILLVWFGGVLRWAVGVPSPYFTDIDVVNFGLAAEHFDILRHQPHPPGYIGYVLYLKLIALVPGLDPLEIAKWGARIMGTACIPMAYWACRQLTGKADGRALWAAALVMVQPVLWFYGADGQSHSSEALALLGLFGLAARWRPEPSLRRVVVFCLLAGLAGAFRPTIIVSAIPIVVWLLWRQRPVWWLAGGLAGAVGALAWWLPTVISVGGLDMYRRVSNSLVGELFLRNFSFLSSEAPSAGVRSNLVATAFAGLMAASALIAWGRGGARFARPLLATIGISLLFYAATFLSEIGYVTGLCALACLVPASWPERPTARHHLRAGLVAAAFTGWFLLAPSSIHLPRIIPILDPTLRHIQATQAQEELYAELVCSPQWPHTLLLTDGHDDTLTRSASFACPGLVSGTQLYKFVLRRDLDAWIFMSDRTLLSVPSKVPVENGPPADVTLPWKFDRVLVGPAASEQLQDRIRAEATCPPVELKPYPDLPLEMHEYPVRCVRKLELSAHTIRIQPTP